MKVRLRTMYKPLDGSRVTWLSQTIQRDWPSWPLKDDVIMLDHDHDVTVKERTFERDGSVTLWIQADEEDLEFIKTLGFTEDRR